MVKKRFFSMTFLTILTIFLHINNFSQLTIRSSKFTEHLHEELGFEIMRPLAFSSYFFNKCSCVKVFSMEVGVFNYLLHVGFFIWFQESFVFNDKGFEVLSFDALPIWPSHL